MRKLISCGLLSFLLVASAALWAQPPAGSPGVESRLKQAAALVEKGDWKAVEEILLPLLSELREQHDEQNTATASFLLSRAKTAQGDYQGAITLDEFLLKFYQEHKNPASVVEVSNHLGAIYSALGKSQQAEVNFSRALQVAEEIKNPNGTLVAVNGLAGVFADRRDFDKSLEYYRRALDLSVSVGNKRRQAAVLQNTGLLYSSMGDYTSALQYFDKALPLYKELNNPSLMARLFINLSDAYLSVGEYLKARDAAKQAYEMAQQNALAPLEMNALHNLGWAMHYRGDYKAAIDNYLAALALAQSIKDSRNEGDILNSIGEAYFRLGDFKTAANYHQRALEKVREFNRPVLTGLLLRNVAGDYANSQKVGEAISTLSEALALAEKEKDRSLKGFAANDLGALYLDQGDPAKAREYFDRALQVRREIGDKRGEAETLMYLGMLEFQAKHFEAAARHFDGAISTAKAIGHPETLWRAEWGKARVLQEQDKKTDAITALKDSVDVIEEIRRSVAPNTLADAMFFANKQGVYELLIQLLIETGDHEKAYEYLERSKSKQLQDKIKLTSIPFKSAQVRGLMNEAEDLFDAEARLREQLVAERAKTEPLRSSRKIDHLSELLAANKSQFFRVVNELRQIHPDYERFVTVKPPSLAKVQRLIPADALVLEYFPSETALYIFEITNTEFKLRSVAVSREQLNSLVKTYRGEMRSTVDQLRARMLTRTRRIRGPAPAEVGQSSMPTVRAAVVQLYRDLITPVEEDMATKKVITIIPSGLLYYLPFPALAKEENGSLKYLIESKAVSYLSSSDLFDLVFVKNHSDERDNLVAFGNPDGTLPSALDEVERLKLIYPNSKVYMLWEAKKERLFDLPKGTDLLHLATHGRLDSADVNESYIKMASEGTKGMGKLRLSEIYDLPLENTSLVTLSACETALGEKDPGTEIASLAQAFSIAGANTVVASLWAVYDPSTAEIMDSFYHELRKGVPKAEALQHAQIAILHNPKYANPYFWAPFIMLGDWR
ncbi:MAG: tetratricopeptide repeat protein [Acidobacteriia bacterium]|nr:tetratricopeptide repeat protein [Terriglobia bacterium]